MGLVDLAKLQLTLQKLIHRHYKKMWVHLELGFFPLLIAQVVRACGVLIKIGVNQKFALIAKIISLLFSVGL